MFYNIYFFVFVILIVISIAIFFIWHYAKKSIAKTEQRLTETFKALSFDTLEKNNKSFVDLAAAYFEKHSKEIELEQKQNSKSIESVLDPIKTALDKLQKNNVEMEKERASAYSSLSMQVKNLVDSERMLREETHNLSKALKSPNIRGAWGQIHLRRVVELAGMLDNCDFYEQKSFSTEEGTYRPDLIVKLPGNRQIIVDAKTPIEAFLESVETTDQNLKKEKLKDHARHIKKHIKDLSSKNYWKHISLSPEYVILFLPAEAFFSAALQQDPSLLEIGARDNVVIATPTTLIAILRAVAFSWRQEKISKNTKEITELGKELYERLGIMNGHWEKLGKNLSSSVESYNQALSSLESRVLVSARKLKEICLNTTEKDQIDILKQITKTTKYIK